MLKSCLFCLRTFHKRFKPKQYQLSHDYFSFWVDLDHVDDLVAKHRLISRNQFNLYSFYDEDHFPGFEGNIKQRVVHYLNQQWPEAIVGGTELRVLALTNFRVLGYVFNPVTFYVCLLGNEPLCAIAEVENTFYEVKPYLIPYTPLGSFDFECVVEKQFYVSPFAKLDQQFHFKFNLPSPYFYAAVDTLDDEGVVLVSSLKGTPEELSDFNLLKLTLCYPLAPLAVIMMIHWHAFCLWVNGFPFQSKQVSLELQTGVLRPSKGL